MGNLTTTSNEFKTKIYNHFRNGWTGETHTTDTGEGWQITTLKLASGFLSSTATKVDFLENGSISWSFGAKQIHLLKEKGRATEKTISEQHKKAVELFKVHPDFLEHEQKPIFKIEIGQRVFLDGYDKGQKDGNQIIYKIDGRTFYTIDTDTLDLKFCDYLRPYSEKFGIGTYYIEGDNFKGTHEELTALVEKAKSHKIRLQEEAKADAEIKEAVRLQKIEEGKKHVIIPTGAKFVIVADMYQNDSDTMTDYFATSVSTTIILAFSKSEKNNMQELKKACLNHEETTVFFEGGKDYEHTEKQSYLPNYFLGSSSWSGWKVHKCGKYGSINLETEQGRNEIYLAFAEGRYFVADSEQEEPETANFEAVAVPHGEIQIIDYSEKAIAVIGDTKPIKEQLKDLGGRFNFRLSCGAGWIFPKTKLTEIENLLSA